MYIPPSIAKAYYEQFIEALSLQNCIQGKNVLILGDFNAPNIDFNQNDFKCILLRKFSSLLGLRQLNAVRNISGRTLDLVFSNIECGIMEDELAISRVDNYHPPLRVTVVGRIEQKKQFGVCRDESRSFNFRKANFPQLYSKILNTDWSSIYNCSNIDEACEKFYNVLHNIFKETVPYKMSRNRRYPTWYTREIIDLIKEKEKAYKKYRTHGTDHFHDIFKNIRRTLKNLIDTAFKNYIKITEENISRDSSEFWSFIQAKKGFSRVPGVLRDGSTEYSKPQDIVNAFSDFFEGVFIDSKSDSMHECDITSNQTINIQKIKESDIIGASKKLKNKPTAGTDQVPSFVVKDCIGAFVAPLCFLFNLSISSGIFPTCWKTARVTPIFKKGDRCDLHDYRPISILCNFSKLFEICIYNQIYSQIKSLISPDQHGFMEKRSCVTNLGCLSEFICSILDNQGQIDVIYTDFQKAFDQIDLYILLRKLDGLGFSSKLLKLLESYLLERRQFVEIEGFRSYEYIVRSGVPQGSNLGPLLFLLFINDLAVLLTCLKLLFADDLKIYCEISTISDCQRLQSELDLVSSWCDNNRLNLNISKCFVVSYSRKKSIINFKYEIKSQELIRCDKIKDLGVMFDESFNFNEHLQKTTLSASKSLGFILRNGRAFENLSTLGVLFDSFVRSKLEYAAIIWHPIYQVGVDLLESVQRRFVKYLAFRQDGTYPARGTPQSLLLGRFSLISLDDRRKMMAICFLYKLINNKIDCISLLNQLTFCVPRQNSRHPSTFYCERPNNNILTRSPLYFMCNLFNNIGNDIDLFSDSLESIKKKCL